MRIAGLGTILLCGAAVYGGPLGDADVQAIIKKSVAVTEEDWKKAPGYAYVERDLTSKKNHTASSKTYEVVMIDGSQYNKLIAVNDRPLSKEEQAAEEQK